MASEPFACDLFALTATQRQRHAALIEQLSRAIQSVQELPDGYAVGYSLDGATWSAVTEWIDLERRCCPFLSFTLQLKPGEPLWLQVTGPEGIKAFLAEELPQLTR
jgi:hypothetical protein